jgi:hypothetical protein
MLNLYSIFPPQNPNRVALKKLKQLGYPLPNIIRALAKLNGLGVNDLAGSQTSAASISSTISGRKHSKIAIRQISQKLNLEENELFAEK